jgi:hypothetical protein
MYLLRRFHPDPSRVRRCWRGFGYNDQEIAEIAAKGRQILARHLPDLPEVSDESRSA